LKGTEVPLLFRWLVVSAQLFARTPRFVVDRAERGYEFGGPVVDHAGARRAVVSQHHPVVERLATDQRTLACSAVAGAFALPFQGRVGLRVLAFADEGTEQHHLVSFWVSRPSRAMSMG